MKKILIYYSILIIGGCASSIDSSSMEGLYAAYHQNYFDKTHDTLAITKANDGKGIYKISRYAGYIRTMDGKASPKMIIKEIYITRYNEENKIFEELRTGKTFIWDSRKQVIVFGNTVFVKIK